MIRKHDKTGLGIVTALLLHALSFSAYGETYKCHVVLENGKDKIIFSESDEDYKAVLEAKHRHIPKQGKKIKVVDVKECQLKNEDFASDAANELYADTPQ